MKDGLRMKFEILVNGKPIKTQELDDSEVTKYGKEHCLKTIKEDITKALLVSGYTIKKKDN